MTPGKKLKISLPIGKPILSRNLLMQYDVEKGTILNIVSEKSGFKISAKAIALSSGQIGEVVDVTNISSGLLLKARVKSSKEVEALGFKFN